MKKIIVLLLGFLVLTSFDNNVPLQAFSIVGQWEGTDETGETGRFNFDNEGYVALTKGGITMGGKNYDDHGKKVNLTYRFDTTYTPAHLDILVKEEGSEKGRNMLLLVKIIDNNTIVMAQEGGARPKGVTDDNSMTFKRTQ